MLSQLYENFSVPTNLYNKLGVLYIDYVFVLLTWEYLIRIFVARSVTVDEPRIRLAAFWAAAVVYSSNFL
jgi:hypothetical protein